MSAPSIRRRQIYVCRRAVSGPGLPLPVGPKVFFVQDRVEEFARPFRNRRSVGRGGAIAPAGQAGPLAPSPAPSSARGGVVAPSAFRRGGRRLACSCSSQRHVFPVLRSQESFVSLLHPLRSSRPGTEGGVPHPAAGRYSPRTRHSREAAPLPI